MPSATVYKKLVFAVYGKAGIPPGYFGPHDYQACPSTTMWDWSGCMTPAHAIPLSSAGRR